MPYFVRLSDRDATCKDCGEKIEAFDPRVDYERSADDTPTGKKPGWHTLRYCMECALPRMRVDSKDLTHQVRALEVMWELTRRRIGRKKLKKTKPPKPIQKPCRCGELAVQLMKSRGYGKLFVCPKGHFWVE